MEKKAQLFSGDIAIASMVFLSALSLVFLLWNTLISDINRDEALRDMENFAVGVTEQLIRTPGVPVDWNIYTVKVIGLTSEDRILNSSKVLNFIQLMNATNSTNYHDNKHLLGVGLYDFYLNITYLDGNTATVQGMQCIAGLAPVNEIDKITITRTAILYDDIVRIKFTMWR